jgi:DNA-binding transcriptional regulator YdaS (Cro superfamily)
MNWVKVAVENAGGVTALAPRINVSRQAIYLWIEKGSIPPRRCADVERETGVPREKLNQVFQSA